MNIDDAPALGPEGTLRSIPAEGILEILTLSAMSGTLHLERWDEAATVRIDRGEVQEAVLGVLRGEKVLRRISEWTEGSFYFVAGP